MEKEVWKDVNEWEGLYQVSNLGRIRSVDRIIIRSDGKVKKFKGKILKCHTNDNGYVIKSLYRNCKSKSYKVHRLVAQAFIPNPENKPQVNHKNGIRTDNRLENLEWVTRSENMLHGFYVLGNAKRVYQYSEDGEFINSYPSARIASEETGTNRRSISASACSNDESKTANGYIWKYESN